MRMTGLRRKRRRDGANRLGGIDDIVPPARSHRPLSIDSERYDGRRQAKDTESPLHEFRSSAREYSALLVAGEYKHESEAAN